MPGLACCLGLGVRSVTLTFMHILKSIRNLWYNYVLPANLFVLYVKGIPANMQWSDSMYSDSGTLLASTKIILFLPRLTPSLPSIYLPPLPTPTLFRSMQRSTQDSGLRMKKGYGTMPRTHVVTRRTKAICICWPASQTISSQLVETPKNPTRHCLLQTECPRSRK